MKFALLAAAALTGSTANAEIYLKEQFNDDVRFHFCGITFIIIFLQCRRSTAQN